LKIALFDEEVIAADFMISQILSIFSPIGISPVTSLCLILLIFSLRITSYPSLSTFPHFTFVIPGLLSFYFIGCKEYSKSIDKFIGW
jgi:hypothetical protein